MNRKKRGKWIGAWGALVVHIAIIVLLILLNITIPEHEEESGVEVMMGNVESAFGGFEPSSLVDVDILPQPELPTEAESLPPSERDLLTQDTEETVVVEPKPTPPKDTPKKTEKSEAEKAAEARRLAEAKAERERRAAAQAAEQKVAGAFGKGAQMGDKGTNSGSGVEGSPTGNASTGAPTGTGGYGTFDLGGRSIGAGGLPRPAYNVQDEGIVVVAITVNPSGAVIATNIDRKTNTVNSALRKAAEDAAKKARFNAVDEVNNQTGTITYRFNLK